jgi:hypothetical protein
MLVNGLTDVELVDLDAMYFVCSIAMVSALLHDRTWILVISQANELRVSKMISTGPLQELDFGHNARFYPNAFLHLLGRPVPVPIARLPSQVDSRTDISLFQEV